MARDVPEITYTYTGRVDTVDTFLATVLPGATLDGGYITGRRTNETAGPGRAEVQVTVAFEPDFAAYSVFPQTSQKTSSISATVASSGIIDGASSVDAKRDVSYYSPEARYTYFASSRPLDARFSSEGTSRTIKIIRSVIAAQGAVDGSVVNKTFGGGNAPAALVSALFMPEADRVTSHEATPIEGTPWYACTDVVSRELEGDS